MSSQQNDGNAWLLKVTSLNGAEFSLDAAMLKLEDKYSFVDADFYDSEQLALLCSEGSESMCMSLVSYSEEDLTFRPVTSNTYLSSVPVSTEELEMTCVNSVHTGSRPFTHIYTGRNPKSSFGSIFRHSPNRIIVYDVLYEEDEEEDSDE